MTVEFVNAISASSLRRHEDSAAFRFVDADHVARYARTLEQWGFDHTLVPYGSASWDQFVVATTVANATETLRPVVALRPNTAFPTVAAQALSTLDQVSQGRVTVHIISGGDDREQRRQGDYLSKPERYARSEEFIGILRQAWGSTEPFDHEGTYYRFENFGPAAPTYEGRQIPVSFGGLSEDAIRVGAATSDIFALWGEPLAETQQQIDRVHAEAARIGRTDPFRFWVTFRPIVAETDALAEAKAERIVAELETAYAKTGSKAHRADATNVGTVRLREIAAQQERHDTALWTPKNIAGNGGASSFLVGSPETVAEAIVKYVELGADIVSLPTLGDIGDAIDAGRYVIPLVREELANRALREGAASIAS